MKSKTSFFNTGICLNYLKRCWPLWAAYLGAAILIIPGSIMNNLRYVPNRGTESLFWYQLELNRSVLSAGHGMLYFSFAAGVVAAMAMFAFLYNNRSCSMMCSLPVHRETLFTTAYFTGLVPMLLINVLVVMGTAAVAAEPGKANAAYFGTLLYMSCAGIVAFYSFAVFCAMLTGSIVVLPAVYGLLNITVLLAEQCVSQVLSNIIYGYTMGSGKLTAFSPIAAVDRWFYPQSEMTRVVENGASYMKETGAFTIDRLGLLGVYCVVGLLLAAAALWLFRRRSMETAGDVVAVPILKPIFRYCMCFGVAFTFACIAYNKNLFFSCPGFADAMFVLALLLIGGFMGYFAAEMMMQKTLRVFGSKWLGFGISALVLIAFVFTAELDLTGYENRVPDVDEIESVELSFYDDVTLERPESLEVITAYHRRLVEEKPIHEKTDNWNMIRFRYNLKDGSVLTRRYSINMELAQQLDEHSAINAAYPVVNLQEAIDRRTATEIPMTVESIHNPMLSGYYIDENGEYQNIQYKLTAEQAVALYECYLQDAKIGKVARYFPVNNEEYFTNATMISFSFSLIDQDKEQYYHDFTMYMDAPHSLNWIEENTDVPMMSVKEAEPQSYENRYVGYDYKEALSSTVAVG